MHAGSNTHLVVVHAPELDLPVVRPGDDERHAGVEGGPVHAPVVPLQHVLHHRVSLFKGDIYNSGWGSGSGGSACF